MIGRDVIMYVYIHLCEIKNHGNFKTQIHTQSNIENI